MAFGWSKIWNLLLANTSLNDIFSIKGNIKESNKVTEYDELGRIISIGDNTFGNKTYSYDEKTGYLSEDNERTYSYDLEGNILTNGENIITYNSDNHLLVNCINGVK